jgi:predicted GTPase
MAPHFEPTRVLILGAAGRDFHNFNTVYRDDPRHRVVAFTATQIPGISGRRYPAELAGALYPEGIAIVAESELEALVRQSRIDQVVFAYSDVTHEQVMHLASRALAAGADFKLLGPERTMLRAKVPVIAISATRTGTGKSQVARYVMRLLRERGLRTVAIRHPMPYGDLAAERVQRFASRADLEAAHCTIEEREEYEPHIAAGGVVYAGVDYAAILQQAETEAEVIVWDGGNNDFPFLKPDLHIVLTDALRPGHESRYHPGETALRMADVIVLAKADATKDLTALAASAKALNPRASVLRGASPVVLEQAQSVRGRRVLLVEDGPTLTHGGMAHGAAYAAAMQAGVTEIIDPRAHATPELAAVYAQYPHIGPVLPAMGYSPAQIDALRTTILNAGAEFVLAGTPIDLAALLAIPTPVLRVRYEFAELDSPGLRDAIERFLSRRLKSAP